MTKINTVECSYFYEVSSLKSFYYVAETGIEEAKHTVNKILINSGADPFHLGGYPNMTSGSGYQQWVPHYGYGYQEPVPPTYLSPSPHPLQPPQNF